MAGSQVTIPISCIEKQRTGYQAISLTNFNNDNEPQIAAGSVVEIGGSSALFQFTAPESITGWGAIGNNNDVYIKCVVSGTSVTAEFTTAAPTWNTARQGWYVGLDRYIGGCYKDASGNYSYKWLYADKPAEKGGCSYDVGDIVSCIVKSKPGCLWCNGDTISNVANPEYSRLIYFLKKEAGADAAHPYYHADSDKAKLPDIRGAVIRGIDTAANRDKNGVRKSGHYQADDNKAHNHPLEIGDGSGALVTDVNYQNVTSKGTEWNLGGGGSTEVTVKNIALYYLIKY